MKLPGPEISCRGFLGSLALTAFPSLQSPPGEENVPPPVDGIHTLKSSIYGSKGICFDTHDNLLIVDSLHCRVRKVDAETRIITTIAGDGRYRFAGDNGRRPRNTLNGRQSPGAALISVTRGFLKNFERRGRIVTFARGETVSMSLTFLDEK